MERVEDVLELGQEVEVTVDEVDPNGKVSLSLAGAALEPKEGGGDDGGADTDTGGDREFVSFEDEFDDEARASFGDLGPADTSGGGAGGGARSGGGRGDRGGRGRGSRRR